MKALFTALAGLLFSTFVFGQALQNKLSHELETTLKKGSSRDEIKLLVSVKDTALFQKNDGAFVLHQSGNAFLVSTKVSLIPAFLKDDNVSFLNDWRQPKEELTTGTFDLSLNKINFVHSKYP